MQRILLKPLPENRTLTEAAADDNDLEKISHYLSELRLLKDVPFPYLVPDETLLPPESIRFFHLDENWLNALTDGALSIGRVAKLDAQTDYQCFETITQAATEKLSCSRFEKMHVNHRCSENAAPVSSEVRTGLLLRSQLVGKWNGLEVFAYNGDTPINILRMEKLSHDILICIFDGELTKFVISEPKTSLRFGAPDHTGSITLRDVSDTKDFGNPLHVKTNLNDFTEPNGKLRVTDLAKDFEQKIKSPITSPEFAFELIAVAKRAEFLKNDDQR